MSRSLLKMSCLIAATRQTPEESKIQVELSDILHSASYIQRWGNYMIELIQNSGRTLTQRSIDRILVTISKNPGITRSAIMQRHHLTKREADEVFGTLEDRGQIKLIKQGRGATIWAI
jgi:ribosomal protein S25